MKTEDNENTSSLNRLEMDKLAIEREREMHLQRSFSENTTFDWKNLQNVQDNEN